MTDLIDKHGGFRRLHSFTLATIVQLETMRFCRRFHTYDARQADTKFYDPKGRQYDQMTQAARSGRQNIIEGSERSATEAHGRIAGEPRRAARRLRDLHSRPAAGPMVGPFTGGKGSERDLARSGHVYRRHGP